MRSRMLRRSLNITDSHPPTIPENRSVATTTNTLAYITIVVARCDVGRGPERLLRKSRSGFQTAKFLGLLDSQVSRAFRQPSFSCDQEVKEYQYGWSSFVGT